jgi:dipeptidyl aminopeptidase/acylaminoacyl peptidase
VRRILLTIAVVAALVYGAAVLYMVSQETRLVFAAGRPLAPGRPAQPFEQVDLPRADGLRQFAFALPHQGGDNGRPWVLFLHGNRATVASRVNIVRYEQLRGVGLNVLAPEYRGFGGLDGTPTEATVTADARNGYEYLRNMLHITPNRIVIYGWSLGSAVAVNVASQVPEAAVILEGAPASVVAIGQRQYPWMPIRTVMRNPFESITKVQRITAPALFIHSPEDAVIPIEEGRRLFDAANPPKEFVEVRGGHIDPADVDAQRMFGAVRRFLEQRGLLPNEGS